MTTATIHNITHMMQDLDLIYELIAELNEKTAHYKSDRDDIFAQLDEVKARGAVDLEDADTNLIGILVGYFVSYYPELTQKYRDTEDEQYIDDQLDEILSSLGFCYWIIRDSFYINLATYEPELI